MAEHPPLKVALVGALGKVAAPCHLNVLRSLPSLELSALCDVDEAGLRQLAHQYEVGQVYTRYDELLADPGIDVVDLVVPPFLHAEMTIAAAQAGKHVYVEKPMALSRSQAQQMIQAATAGAVYLMVGESYFFHGPHRLARDLIQEGEVGEIRQIRQYKQAWLFNESENRRLQGRGHDVAWRFDPRLSGGGQFPWIMDHGPHLFATARLFSSSGIRTVAALQREHGVGREQQLRGITAISWAHVDDAVDGMWLHCETMPAAGPWIGFRTEILGTKGTLRVFGEGGGAAPGFPQVAPVTLYRQGNARDFQLDASCDRSWVSNNSYYDEAHRNVWSHFADAVMNERPLEYNGASGLEDLTATLATIQSAVRGCATEVSSIADDWHAWET